MNYFTIGILVIIIVICLYTVFYFLNTTYIFDKTKPLNEIYKVGLDKIEQPDSIRYYYEMWLLVDGNFPADKINVIFGRGNSFIVGLKGSDLSFYYGTGSNKGTYDASRGVFATGTDTKTMSIAKNFPFQKWTHFLLNVDSGTVDAYLDGKLVTSIQPDAGNQNSSTYIPYADASNNIINIGNIYTQGKITRFSRVASNVNPQEVWNHYMLGNGLGTSLTPYHIDLKILKDNKEQNNTRIF